MSEPPKKRQRVSFFERVNRNANPSQIPALVSSSNSHNCNQSNHIQHSNDTNNMQQSAITLPEPLQRKKPWKKKPVANKIDDIIRKCIN